MNYILTCNENTRKHLTDAFAYYNLQGSFDWFNSTECLFTSSMDNETFVSLIEKTPLLFVRHLFEVQNIVSNKDLVSTILDLPLNPQLSFSIQLRSPQHLRQEVNALRNQCVETLKERGFTFDVKNPEQIISVFVDSEKSYIGLGNASLNLSTWSAGAMHFSKDQAMISRAEYKLLEAIDVFDLPVQGGLAIDLGAAPGGWSLVLANRGYQVHAIDPAFLDERVYNNKSITHHQISAQAFLESHSDNRFDMIVNDMKMSYPQSIELFRTFAESLSPYGMGIITLKLSKNFRFTDTVDALKRIRYHFDILHARQLFHNRNEFTVAVKGKSDHETLES